MPKTTPEPHTPGEELPGFSPRLVVMPAYGRRYDTPAEATADWLDGKDFKVVASGYLSIRDYDYLLAHGVEEIIVAGPEGNVIARCPLIGEGSEETKSAALAARPMSGTAGMVGKDAP